ncbi:MAG: hypothetical protein QOK07_928 [Gemmatimonadaceae bacterium]|nr:hypothetical protein [Gemmatimonadaceae bacterium]
MRAEFLVLRLVHILSGIVWLGSGVFTGIFLIPALSGAPATMGQVVAGLQRRRYFVFVPIIATLTILSGLRLLWITSAGFAPGYFATGTGRTFAISAVGAIVAFVLSLGIARPAAVRAGKISASLAGTPDAPERERLLPELDRMRRRSAWATSAAIGFGIVAASGMAIARYV